MAAETKRTVTGVSGLDEILFGGIPINNLVVISGDPGSGKTCLCLEFLYMGATKYDEPGVYVSLEESEDEILKMADNFGWEVRKLIAARKLLIIAVELYDFDKLKNTIEDVVARIGAKRLVIDPGVVFRLYFERELDARKRILSLARMLKRIGCTAIITNEIALDKTSSLFGLEEYVADGVILLYHTKLEDRFVRSIGILKMRGTKISEKLHPIEITKEGIKILAKHELFEEVE
ncbi:MAG TPA: ATPase domain-containing protein [archaeon]|nr:ATPase domain-containing protein [archaeon]